MLEPRRPRRLGLTGNIGAGKSTVAALLRARGLTVLDADEQARLATGEPEVLAQIAAAFPGVVAQGALDRAALAAQVFSDPERLAQLNAIVHPRVRERMAALEAQAAAAGAPWVVQDVPLLFESGLDAAMDAVLVVDAPLETRLARLEDRGLPRADALAREARQLDPAQKRRRAGAVVDNGGTLEQLEVALDAALGRLGVTPGA